jgi:hypothetical protein
VADIKMHQVDLGPDRGVQVNLPTGPISLITVIQEANSTAKIQIPTSHGTVSLEPDHSNQKLYFTRMSGDRRQVLTKNGNWQNHSEGFPTNSLCLFV